MFQQHIKSYLEWKKFWLSCNPMTLNESQGQTGIKLQKLVVCIIKTKFDSMTVNDVYDDDDNDDFNPPNGWQSSFPQWPEIITQSWQTKGTL